MDLAAFAEGIGGEMVAGCVIATVDGKRQYLYQAGEFTLVGRKLYNEWTHLIAEANVAIASSETELPRKSHKSMRNRHGG